VLNSIQRFKFKSTMIAAAMAVLPMSAFAAGLGKLTVLSALGQPLRAELDITASRDELASLGAHVAPAETFQQAGIEYVPAAAALKFLVDKRSGGQPFLRVSSDRAINEPFIDVLIELVWSSGRMVREYTVLLDPPNLAKPNVPAVAESAPVVATPVVIPKAVPTAAPAAPAVAIAPAAPEKAAE
jgi:pilus assembly protein FimV